jgi:BASS family bile acid:Na+ symporter
MQPWFTVAILCLKASIFLQVLAVGFGTTWQDATYLFRRPRLLADSIMARNVIVPLVAVLLIRAFSFNVAMAITLAVLAVTPVPPLLPRSQLRVGCSSAYVLGLLVSQAVLAVFLVPVTIRLMDLALGGGAHFSMVQAAMLVLQTILLPLGAGMLASRHVRKVHRFAPWVVAAGTVLLIVGAIPLLILGWKVFPALTGNGAMLALAIFIVAGTLAGHFLGGPASEDRTALALATSSRHPGLALAIAHANFPAQFKLVAGAVVIYLILRTALLLLYLWAARASWKSQSGAYGTRRVHP